MDEFLRVGGDLLPGFLTEALVNFSGQLALQLQPLELGLQRRLGLVEAVILQLEVALGSEDVAQRLDPGARRRQPLEVLV